VDPSWPRAPIGLAAGGVTPVGCKYPVTGSTSLLSQSSVGLKDIEHPSSLLPIRVQARCISSERHVKA